MSKLSVLVVLAALFCVSFAQLNEEVPYKLCSQDNILKIKTLTGEPYPFKRGTDLHINITGTLDTEITGGKYNLDVKLFGVHIYGDSGDLCTWSPTFKCPSKGDVVFAITQQIPSVAPAGQYDIMMQAVDTNGKNIICVSVDTKISEPNTAVM